MRENYAAAKAMVMLAFQADRRGAVVMLGLRTAQAVALVLSSYFLKLVVDAAVDRDPGKAVVGAVGIAGCLAVSQFSGRTAFNQRIELEENMSLLIDSRLITMAAAVPGIEHHERPEYVTEMELLRDARIALSQTAGSVLEALAVVIRAVGTAVLLAGIHPVLLALPLFAAPSLLLGNVAQKKHIKAQEEGAEDSRLGTMLFELGTTAGPAKELRIFGLEEDLVRRHRDAWLSQYRRLGRSQARTALLTTVGWLIFVAGYTASVVFVATRAVRGQASVGDVFLSMNLASQVNGQVAQFVATYNWSINTLKAAKRYLWLQDYAAERTGAGAAPAPDRLIQGISLEGVGFRYPGTEAEVLADVSLAIPAGTTVALVGENGAGKTTLVKLLCRFYEPTSGTIRIDGVDLTDIGVDAWRERMAAGFQDFAQLELLARDSIGVGKLADRQSNTKVIAALDRASASELPGRLPLGLDTQLGKTFEDGVELSIGQWQKVALGRAMMREAPLLLVLDEPTASLDAPTEHALFDRYAGAARRVAEGNGAITILVSHRFSTVRMADLILVVEDGTVSELGSHDELMALGGTYAELYELQARAYR